MRPLHIFFAKGDILSPTTIPIPTIFFGNANTEAGSKTLFKRYGTSIWNVPTHKVEYGTYRRNIQLTFLNLGQLKEKMTISYLVTGLAREPEGAEMSAPGTAMFSTFWMLVLETPRYRLQKARK
jgi:hypothetical protein